MSGRFSKPVWPGDKLTVRVWFLSDGMAAFRTETQSGEVVIDRGRLGYLDGAPITTDGRAGQ
jgi:acyl dehydratase